MEPKIHFHCPKIQENRGDAYMRLPVESVRDACAIVAGWLLCNDSVGGNEFKGVYYKQADPELREEGIKGHVYYYNNDDHDAVAEVASYDGDGNILYVYFHA